MGSKLNSFTRQCSSFENIFNHLSFRNNTNNSIHFGYISLDRKWHPYGRVLIVKLLFSLSNSIKEKEKYTNVIQWSINKWNKQLQGALHLQIDNSAIHAEIRISFKENQGHFSYIGTDCETKVSEYEATMNLDISEYNCDKSEEYNIKFYTAVLHEFGHAIGFLHEHQNPYRLIVWNSNEIINSIKHTCDFSTNDINEQVLQFSKESPKLGIVQSYIDTSSIMCYEFDKSWINEKETMDNFIELKKLGKLDITPEEAYNNLFKINTDFTSYDIEAIKLFYPLRKYKKQKMKFSYSAKVLSSYHNISIITNGYYNIIYNKNNKNQGIIIEIREQKTDTFIFRYKKDVSFKDISCNIYLKKSDYWLEIQSDKKLEGELSIQYIVDLSGIFKTFMPYPGGKLTLLQQKNIYNRQRKIGNGYDITKKEGERNAACIATILKRMPLDTIQTLLQRLFIKPESEYIQSISISPRLLQSILSSKQLLPSYFLYKGAAVANAVGRIATKSTFATGFMVSSILLLTNYHVFQSINDAIGASIQFDYYLSKTPISFKCNPSKFFFNNEELDFALVAVSKISEKNNIPLSSRGYIKLSSMNNLSISEKLNIIQHPGGKRQEISLRNHSVLAKIDSTFVHYDTSKPGSSGSPIFNDNWDLVALHHSAVPKRNKNGIILKLDGSEFDIQRDDRTLINWIANEGILIPAIIEFLKTNKMDIFNHNQYIIDDLLSNKDEGLRFDTQKIEINNLLNMNIENSISVNIGNIKYTLSGLSSPKLRYHEIDKKQSLLNLKTEIKDYSKNLNRRKDIIQNYYSDLDISSLHMRDLVFLIKNTHNPIQSFKKATLDYLYPIVDIYSNGKLYCICNKTLLDPINIINNEYNSHVQVSEHFDILSSQKDLNIYELQYAWKESIKKGITKSNCVHAVPSFIFNKQKIPYNDLHHIFVCGNIIAKQCENNYSIFNFCKEDYIFDNTNKGIIARSILYFCLRYPKYYLMHIEWFNINEIIKWSKVIEPTKWEKRRNDRISQIQGNRNPFIDYWNKNLEDKLLKMLNNTSPSY